MTLVPETEAIIGLMVIYICQEGDKQEDLREFPLISWHRKCRQELQFTVKVYKTNLRGNMANHSFNVFIIVVQHELLVGVMKF